MSLEELNVHIGEVKLGTKGQSLHALLGSCIGVAILWPERDLYGLAHCLLAKFPGKKWQKGGRYVDQAIHTLLHMMKVTKEDYGKVRVVVAGGGNMTKPENTNPEKLVGHQNKQCALTTLKSLNLKIIHEDTGGTLGRRISINCDDGTFNVKSIPRPIAA